MIRSAIPLLVTGLAIVPPASGQVAGAGDSNAAVRSTRLSRLERGARVRVTAPSISLEREIGTLGAVQGDTLFLEAGRFGESPTAVPLSAVTRLEVSEGRKGNAGLGMRVGALAGFLAGVAVAASQIEKRTCDLEQEGLDCLGPDFDDLGSDLAAGLGMTMLGTVGGGALGAIVGSAFRTERWARLNDLDLDFSVTVTGGGLGLKFSSRI